VELDDDKLEFYRRDRRYKQVAMAQEA
jgi:hypothetical protein